jgi:hypothetical protein
MAEFIRQTGIYKGIVTNNEDPAGLNRIQVRIPELHGPMKSETLGISKRNSTTSVMWTEDKYLPWAEICYSFGDTTPPEVNQVVWVIFYAGNADYPIIIGWTGYEYTTDEKAFE